MTKGPATIGRYQVRDRLGQGGMGVLYLALDPAIDRLVALKLLRVHSDELRERFLREARLAARLQHPNIVTIYDVGEHDEQPFIAMEYIAGETLAELTQRRAVLPVTRKLGFILDACRGLAYAHKHGIVHRDIKPANLMVGRDTGVLKVLDFGIARGGDSTLTQIGMLMGTPNYMSPEQIEGRPVDRRSDIFALGLVLYELLVYRQAFKSDTPHAVLHQVLHGTPAALRTIDPALDLALVSVVDRAIEKDVERRYQDLDALRGDLARIVKRLEAESDVPTGSARVMRAREEPVGPDGQETSLGGESPVPGRAGDEGRGAAGRAGSDGAGGGADQDRAGAERPAHSRTPWREGDRARLAERRASQIAGHLAAGDTALAAGDMEAALAAAESAALLDADNAQIAHLMDRVRAAIDAREIAEWLNKARLHLEAGALTDASLAVAEALRVDQRHAGARALRTEIERAADARDRQRERDRLVQHVLQQLDESLEAGALEAALRAAGEALGYDPSSAAALAARQRVVAAIEGRVIHAIAATRADIAAGRLTGAADRLRHFTPKHERIDRELADVERRIAAAEAAAAEAARKRAEEEARRQVEEEARRLAEAEAEAARQRAEAEARRKAEEEAERERQAEARRKAEAERLAAEAEARRLAEEKAARERAEAEAARKRAEQEKERVRLAAAAEAKRLAAEAEARRLAEEKAERERLAEAQRRAEAERIAAEAEARRKAEEEAARLRAEEEAAREREAEAARKAEAQRLAAEAEARRKAEEKAERQRLAEARRRAEAERLAAEAEAKRKAEEEAARKAEAQRIAAEAEARRQAEEKAERERLAEAQRRAEAERIAAEAEAKRKAEEEAARLHAEEEAAREREAEAARNAEAQRKAEKEAADRRAAEQAERERQAAAAEAKRLADEAAARREAEEAEAHRLAEAEAARQRAEEQAERERQAEAQRRAEAQRIADEAEAKRRADEDAARVRAEAEAARTRAAEEAERQRQAAAAEARRRAEETEAKRKAEAEAARKRKEEEAERKRQAAAADAAKRKAAADEARRKTEDDAKRRAAATAAAAAAAAATAAAAASAAAGGSSELETETKTRAKADAQAEGSEAEAEAIRRASSEATATSEVGKTATEASEAREEAARQKRVAARAADEDTADANETRVHTLPANVAADARRALGQTGERQAVRVSGGTLSEARAASGASPLARSTSSLALDAAAASDTDDSSTGSSSLASRAPWLAGIAALLLLVFGIAYLVFGRRSPEPPSTAPSTASQQQGTTQPSATPPGNAATGANPPAANLPGSSQPAAGQSAPPNSATGAESTPPVAGTAPVAGVTDSAIPAAQRLDDLLTTARRHFARQQRQRALDDLSRASADLREDPKFQSLVGELTATARRDAEAAHLTAVRASAATRATEEFQRAEAQWQQARTAAQRPASLDTVRSLVRAQELLTAAADTANRASAVAADNGANRPPSSPPPPTTSPSSTTPGGTTATATPPPVSNRPNPPVAPPVAETGLTTRPGTGAGTTPTGTTSAPPTTPGTPTSPGGTAAGSSATPPGDERAAVLQALNAWAAAYATLDVGRVAGVSPLSGDQTRNLKQAFDLQRAHRVTLDDCRITQTPAAATAVCGVQRAIEFKDGKTLQASAKMTFQLARRGGGWAIVSQK